MNTNGTDEADIGSGVGVLLVCVCAAMGKASKGCRNHGNTEPWNHGERITQE